MDKCAIFIDGGYFEKFLKSLGEPNIDYKKLCDKICDVTKTELLRAYYYDCMPHQSNPPTDEEKARYAGKYRWLDKLRSLPRFEVKLGRLNRIGDKFIQKGVDILLSIDLVRLSTKYRIDKAILVSGDSDFVPAITEAKNEGVVVWVVYGEHTKIHNELYNVADERFVITKSFIDSIRLPKRKSSK